MGIFSVEDTVEQVVTGMKDEVIWRIVSKLGGAIAKQFHDHARTVALASVASVPLYVSFQYFRCFVDHIRREWEWEKKCNLSLVSAQLWVPVTADELPAPQDFRVLSYSPAKRRGACFPHDCTDDEHTARQSDEHLGSSTPRSNPLRKPSDRTVRFSCDSSASELEDDGDRIVSVSGVCKRTLWQKDIWQIGVLRDKRMHRAIINAAERTTPEKPFVTEFLQQSDIWYVMNAMINELSSMCGVHHLSAMQKREMYKDADAYVIALMVPRLGADVKREFMGEEFCDTTTCITKLRVIVVKERDLMKMSTQQLALQEDVPSRFRRRWDVLSMMADKYRRFEACKILRHAIRQAEGELAGASPWEVDRSLKRESSVSSLKRESRPSVDQGDQPQRTDSEASDSTASTKGDQSFSVFDVPKRLKSSIPGLRPSRSIELAEQQRAREISKEQFLRASEDLDIPRNAADKLFDLLDIDKNRMLSVDEVDQANRKASRGRNTRPNYVSMHLQRAFLPASISVDCDPREWPS